MAQRSYTKTVADIPLTGDVVVKELGLVHEPDADNTKSVAIFMQVQAIGGAAVELGTIGRFRAEATYVDGTVENVIIGPTPFQGYSIPYQSTAWVLIHTNGVFEAEPAPADDSSIGSNEKFDIQQDKQLRSIKFYWTEDE